MNNIIRNILIFALLSFCSQANALLISEVGGVDSFLTSANLGNSGDATEEAWVESYLGIDVSLTSKYDTDGGEWTLADDVDNTSVYYSQLNTSPEYFFLKVGTGGTDLDTHYLFQNIGDVSYAVVDFLDAGIDFSVRNINIDRLSHIGEISVSEPGTLALLGIGLFGLGLMRKQIYSQA